MISQSGIATALDHIDTVGSGPTMSVTVWFVDVLSDNDFNTLRGVMAAYTNIPPLSNAYMISSIMNAIQTDANVMLLIRAKVASVLPVMSNAQLQMIMTTLGLS